VLRQRFEVSNRFDAKECGVGERPIADRAERRAAVDAQHLVELRHGAFRPAPCPSFRLIKKRTQGPPGACCKRCEDAHSL
jgi:hypothetical protein